MADLPVVAWLELTAVFAGVAYAFGWFVASVDVDEPATEVTNADVGSPTLFQIVVLAVVYTFAYVLLGHFDAFHTPVAEPELPTGLPVVAAWLPAVLGIAVGSAAFQTAIVGVFAPALVAHRGRLSVAGAALGASLRDVGAISAGLAAVYLAGAAFDSLAAVAVVASVAFALWEWLRVQRLTRWGRRVRPPSDAEYEVAQEFVDDSVLDRFPLRVFENDTDRPTNAWIADPMGLPGRRRLYVDAELLSGAPPNVDAMRSFASHALRLRTADLHLLARAVRAVAWTLALVAVVDALPPNPTTVTTLLLLVAAILATFLPEPLVLRERILELDERVVEDIGRSATRAVLEDYGGQLSESGLNEHLHLHTSTERRLEALEGTDLGHTDTPRK